MNISRYWRLIACCAGPFVTSAFYIWSVFTNPLIEAYGWNLAFVVAGYSFNQIFAQISSLIFGRVVDKANPRITYLVGLVLFGGGWFLAGCATSAEMLIFAYSVVAGIGNGALYITATGVSQKWFPDRRGFASGCVIGTAGIAPLMWAPLGQMLLSSFGPSNGLRFLGCVFAVVILIALFLIKRPEEGWVPSSMANVSLAEKAEVLDGKRPSKVLRDPIFWLMLVVFTCAASAGSMVMGHASSICQTMGGMDAMAAATMVGVLSIASFLGRLGLGTVGDKVGRIKPLIFITVVTCLMCLVASQTTGAVVIAALLCIQFCFGGTNTVMNSSCGTLWGSKYVGSNWSLLYIGYTLSAIIGPTLASFCFENTGAYGLSFIVAACISAFAFVVVVVISRVLKSRGNQSI